jgi:hypothetical protein
MVRLKRVIRRDIILSVGVHAGLLLGLFVIASGGVRPVPPPEAMTVEIVPANEAPPIQNDHVDGTPLESTSTGSEVSSEFKAGSASAAPPQPKAAIASLQQAQTRADAQRSSSPAAAQPQTAAPAQPETQPRASEPLLPPTAPTLEPQPHPKEAANRPNAAEMFAMPMALPGGRLGGGFDAPSSTPAMLPHDDIAAFRARLSSCSQLPPGFTVDDDKLAIVVRVSFKRDGTLAATPKLLDAPLSPDVAAMMQTAVDALQRCQPFTELPADKYNRWKTLDLVVTPLALSGG